MPRPTAGQPLVPCSAVPDEDPIADEGPFGQPLPPDDRLWRHPSELAWTTLEDDPAATATRAARVWGVALTSAVTGALLALGVVGLVGGLGSSSNRGVNEAGLAGAGGVAIAAKNQPGGGDLLDRVGASVVRVEVTTETGRRAASGIVYLENGTVLTNAHVVAGSMAIRLVRSDGSVVGGRVVGTDQLTDIAVVAADAEDGSPWSPAALAAGDDLIAGDPVMTVGAARDGELAPRVVESVVKATGRRVATAGRALHGLIETGAAVDELDSGGALCDPEGTVVGLTTSLPTGDGSGFAIPADEVRAVADQLLATGGVRWAWLGIEGADTDGGIAIVAVDPGGPASGAGLQAGDLLVALDGEPVTTMSALVDALRARQAGEAVTVDVVRGIETVRLDAVLAERP